MAIQRGNKDDKDDQSIDSVGDIINRKTPINRAGLHAKSVPRLFEHNPTPVDTSTLQSESDWINYFETQPVINVIEWFSRSDQRNDPTPAVAIRHIISKITSQIDTLPKGHNEWLEYFSDMTREQTESFIESHRETLGNEAMAAGMRWLQIAENPALIDKIVNSRLNQRKAEELGDVVSAARSGDPIKLYETIRDNLAYKIQEGSGARDMTALIKQLNEVTLHLDELYRAAGLKGDQDSSIRKLLVKQRRRANAPQSKVVRADQKISDVEDSESF